ncbi:MAG: type II toxin-antitoxin system RelE/ParE family toxin [Pseudomonadota bacterium]
MSYRLTADAALDLMQVYYEGLELFGVKQAETYQDRLDQAFGAIAINPLASQERAEINPPVRIRPVGAHIIIYVVNLDGVLILNIRHAREDWQNSSA